MINDYLRAIEMPKVADSIQQEIKGNHSYRAGKYVIKQHKAFTKGVEVPRLMTLKKSNYSLNKREVNLDK